MRFAVPALAVLLAGCGAQTATVAPAPAVVSRPPAQTPVGLEGVIGQSARTLTNLFGNAVQDQREASARRLQFSGKLCVLDAYLYPQAAGKEPIVTHIDARRLDGADTDKAACVAALSKR